MTVRVAIDARSLDDTSAFRGIGTYLRNLLSGLAAVDEVSVVALAQAKTELPAGIERSVIRRMRLNRFSEREHRLLLPLDLRRVKADVVHSPALDSPRFSRAPVIATLHDFIPAPDGDVNLGVGAPHWSRTAASFGRAAAVIAVSQLAADSAVTRLGVDPAKMRVIHHGVSEIFHRQTCEPADPPYLLYVSQFNPSKGYADACEVIAILADLGYPHRLKIGGRIWPWVQPEVDAIVAAARRPDRVDLLGYVDHETELPSLYANATAYVSTSRHESFGLPIVEAMAVGVPSLAFDNSSAPEIVGDGGELVADGDAGAMALAVQRVLDEPSVWKARSLAAKEWSARYSWARAVAAHVAVYREVAGV
jgi:glycosyltransferase involved in cell wall biosynthesis